MGVQVAPESALSAVRSAFFDVETIDAVVLYGSFARGTVVTPASDVDILLFSADDEAESRFLTSLASHDRKVARLASLSRSNAQLIATEQARFPSFVAHLRDEGHVMSRSTTASSNISAVLGQIATPRALAAESTRRLERVLPTLEDARLNGCYVGALGRLYTTAKAICMVRLLAIGRPTYDWRLVFDAFAEEWPNVRRQARALEVLRPFYEELRGSPGPAAVAIQAEGSLLREGVDCLKRLAVASE